MLPSLLPELHSNIVKYLNAKDLKNIRCTTKSLQYFGYNGFAQQEFNYLCRVGNQNERVGILLKRIDVDPSARYNDAIRQASKNGHIEVVNRLLQDPRVDPSARDNYAIRFASINGHIEVVNRLLQDNRVDPSDRDNWAIRHASYSGHIEVVNRLLQDGGRSIKGVKKLKKNSIL